MRPIKQLIAGLAAVIATVGLSTALAAPPQPIKNQYIVVLKAPLKAARNRVWASTIWYRACLLRSAEGRFSCSTSTSCAGSRRD